MYAKALRGEISNFTGVSDPYEEPLNPEVVINSQQDNVEESVSKVMAKLRDLGYLNEEEHLPEGRHLQQRKERVVDSPGGCRDQPDRASRWTPSSARGQR